MPFVTEELWQHLSNRLDGSSIMVSPFPKSDQRWIDKNTEEEMQYVQNAINSIRNIRGELTVPPSKEISLILKFTDKTKEDIIKRYQKYFQRLARVNSITTSTNGTKPNQTASAVVVGGEIFIPLEGIIDTAVEKERIEKELKHIENMIQGIENKLSNDNFVSRAPRDVVGKERIKLINFKESYTKLRNNLNQL
jgi:valyl-tRNA synthetase